MPSYETSERYYYFDEKDKITQWLVSKGFPEEDQWSPTICGNCCGFFADQITFGEKSIQHQNGRIDGLTTEEIEELRNYIKTFTDEEYYISENEINSSGSEW